MSACGPPIKSGYHRGGLGEGALERYASWVPAKVSPPLLVLREIRDEIKGTNQRLDRVEGSVAALGERVGGVEVSIGSLERRQTDTPAPSGASVSPTLDCGNTLALLAPD